ncbi:hypothetical protein MRX96_017295 [Rhipicephalus microplus]
MSSMVSVLHVDSKLAAFLDDFFDCFEDLECCKGPPVKLHLKDGTQPQFLKAQTVSSTLRAEVSAEIDRLVELRVLSPDNLEAVLAPPPQPSNVSNYTSTDCTLQQGGAAQAPGSSKSRTSSTLVKKESFETPMTLEHSSTEGLSLPPVTTSSDALQAGQFVPGEPVAGGGIGPAGSGPTEPIQFRRSTRARKPPDRF